MVSACPFSPPRFENPHGLPDSPSPRSDTWAYISRATQTVHYVALSKGAAAISDSLLEGTLGLPPRLRPYTSGTLGAPSCRGLPTQSIRTVHGPFSLFLLFAARARVCPRAPSSFPLFPLQSVRRSLHRPGGPFQSGKSDEKEQLRRAEFHPSRRSSNASAEPTPAAGRISASLSLSVLLCTGGRTLSHRRGRR